MKIGKPFALPLLISLVVLMLPHAAAQNINSVTIVGVCFTSGYGSTSDCASLVTYWIEQANSTIHILIYSLTLPSIEQALVRAAGRGVSVNIVMDRNQAAGTYSQYQNLVSAGVNVRLSNNAYEMHDKVAIIDDHIIITGSFNWTETANTNNDENLLIIDSQALGAVYEQDFQVIWNGSS